MQIVQSQEQDAAEMSEQIQVLEADRDHLQVVTKDLDLAEDRVSLAEPLAHHYMLCFFLLNTVVKLKQHCWCS